MAFTVTPLLTDFDLAEIDTPWTANGISADTENFKQGTQSQSWIATKSGVRNIECDATNQDLSGYTYPHLYFWISSAVASLMEAKSTGTTTRSGVVVRVTLANGAYREWHVAGKDTWTGAWKCFVIDLAHTGTQLFSSSGTWDLSTNSVDIVTVYYDLTNSGNIRNAINCWSDAIRFGEGLQVHNTSAADASFGFAEVAAQDQLVANQWGVLQEFEPGAQGVFGLQGRLEFGDDTSTNHVDFLSNDETVVFLERDGSGYGLVHASLYRMDFVGNSTASDQDVYFGTKVGTGDSASGRNGTKIQAGGPNVSYYIDMTDANLHNVGWYGSTVQGADLGVGATSWAVNTFEIAGCTYDGCGQVDTQTAVVRNCNFLNTVAAATEGALKWGLNQANVRYCLFVNNVVGIEFPTLGANVDLYGMEYSGNTNDIRYEGGSDYDANILGGDTPTILNAAAGTLTAVVAPVTTTFAMQDIDTELPITTAQVLVEASDGTGPLPYRDSVTITRSVSTATVSHTAHGLKTGQKVHIRGADQYEYTGVKVITVTGVNAYTFTVTGTPTTPATGTITSTGVLIAANADVNGEVTDTRSLSAAQPVSGRARSASAEPFYKTAKITGTVSSTTGLEQTILMIRDQ